WQPRTPSSFNSPRSPSRSRFSGSPELALSSSGSAAGWCNSFNRHRVRPAARPRVGSFFSGGEPVSPDPVCGIPTVRPRFVTRPRMSKPPLEKLTRAEWGVVLLLAAINFNHILDFVIVMPLGDRMMKEVPLTTGQFSDVVSAYGIAAALFGLFGAGV